MNGVDFFVDHCLWLGHDRLELKQRVQSLRLVVQLYLTGETSAALIRSYVEDYSRSDVVATFAFELMEVFEMNSR